MDDATKKEIVNLIDEFENLLNNYWYAIQTRGNTPLAGEQDQLEKYAKKLYEEYTAGKLYNFKEAIKK